MDTEKRKQVAAQCKVVEHLAGVLAAVYHDYAEIYGSSEQSQGDVILEMVGNRTARLMETLGDVLNGMDAVEEEDEWVNPIFAKSREMFPRPRDTE